MRRRRPPVLDGYRRILVPLVDEGASAKAIDVARRLASERGASVTAVAVVEVPPLLPLDARMEAEEAQARRLLERASVSCNSYGVDVTTRLLRSRDAGQAILAEAETHEIEVLVLGATAEPRASSGAVAFSGTIEHVLKGATCRVMVVAAPQAADAALDVGEPLPEAAVA